MIKIPENLFPFITIACVVFMLITVISGYRKGALWQLLRIIAIIAVIVLAWVLSPGLAELINIYPKKWMPFSSTNLSDVLYNKINQIAWFIILLVVGLILVFFLIKPILDMVTDIPILRNVNGIVGGIMSLIPVYIVLVLVSYLLSTALFFNGKDVVDHTVLKYIKSSSSYLVKTLSNVFEDNISLQKLFNDPLSLQDSDLKNIIDWLKKLKISSDDIRSFFENYGIDVEKINQFLQQKTN